MAGWVGGSNGNKANLSPAEAGAGLSLAISEENVLKLIHLIEIQGKGAHILLSVI